jgi:hypothetical protein
MLPRCSADDNHLQRDTIQGDAGVATTVTTTDELKSLFKKIHRYKPLDLDLETRLKPFIPDYLPAVGDIDAFVKVPPAWPLEYAAFFL